MAEPDLALEQVRRIALDLPEAEERAIHGQSSFFVGETMFAQFRHDPHGDGRTIIVVKVGDPEEARTLIDAAPQTHSASTDLDGAWVSIDVGSADTDYAHVGDRIARSWELAAPQGLLEAGGR